MYVDIDTTPYDLGIVQAGDKYAVIAAMGNQGVLVRSLEGVWDRYAVSTGGETPRSATPFPYRAASIDDAAQSVVAETGAVLALAYVFLVVLFAAGWASIRSRIGGTARSRMGSTCLPILLAALASLLAVLYVFFGDTSAYGLLGAPLALLVLGIAISWMTVIAICPNRNRGVRAALISLVFPLLLAFGAWLPFALWALGVIPHWEAAVALAMILGIAIVFFGLRMERRTAISAATQSA